ncbi:MAG: hypothetical protein HY301_05380 [Verrucomicrobia bacterium]|nr:hypothetical protein [Verrucomicrobiota bacterium]
MKTFRALVHLLALAAGFAWLTGTLPAQSAPASATNSIIYKRWFTEWQKRAYPINRIPDGARAQALAQIAASKNPGAKGGAPANLAVASGPWVNIGPKPQLNGQIGRTLNTRAMSGRVATIAVAPNNNNHWLIGAAHGGVWETTDAGNSWTPRTDDMPSLAMGAITFAPGNSSIVYAGTGEGVFSGDAFAGGGMLKSTDGGTTWSVIANTPFTGASVSDIQVNPADATMLVAATVYGYAGEDFSFPPSVPSRGVYKSVNGGANWTQRLVADCTSLKSDPGNFSRQYAGLRGGGVSRSLDGGDNWAAITGPWGAANLGRAELAIAPSDPNVIYVSVANAATGGTLGLWRTANAWIATPTWTQVPLGQTDDGSGTFGCCGWDAAFNSASKQCWYSHVLSVDPANSSTLYFGGIPLWKYDGVNWTEVSKTANDPFHGIHVDQHAMAWAGTRLISGNDGGVWSTTDGGASWNDHNTSLAIANFYFGAVHPTDRNFAIGGLQDNGSAKWTGADGWPTIYFGDGTGCAVSSRNPNTDWAVSSQNLNLVRTRDGGNSFSDASGGIDKRDANFVSQVEMHPSEPDRVIVGTDRVWRTDGFFSAATPTWTMNSPDFGGKVVTLAFAPSDASGNIYAVGTSSGALQITLNGGATWTDLDAADAVPDRFVTGLAFDPQNPSILYVTLSGFDEGTPGKPGHVFKTTSARSGAAAWVNISPPANLPHDCIVVDPGAANAIYAGTDIGLWRSLDGGANWTHMGPESGMPNVPVFDLQAGTGTRRIFAFTHGRGVFRLDPDAQDNTPSITSLAPASGAPGSTVAITGNKLNGATAVNFNGLAATFTVNSASSISATVPAGATTGLVSVTTPGGSANSPGNFTVINSPLVTGFTPPSGGIGTDVTITGFNFTGATSVKFNGATAVFNVDSATQISTTVPAAATSGRLSVTTPGGTVNSVAAFTVTALPVVSGFSPPSGPAATQVIITGANFTGATSVKFNGTTATFAVNNAGQITANVPGGATTGPIAVTTANGTGTSANNFLFVSAASVASFTPASGTAGTSVTVTGANFSNVTAVAFNGTAAPQFRVNSPTQLTVDAPAGATTGPISVTALGGSGASATPFTYLAPPGNDNFAAATIISGNAGSATTNNIAATKQAGEPDHAANPGGKSVWFKWTAPAGGAWTFDTAGSGFDTLLAVYTGASVNALTPIASNDNTGVGRTSSVTFTAVNGTTYFIAVDGFKEDAAVDPDAPPLQTASGALVLNWVKLATGPAITGFTPATGIPGTMVVIRGTNFGGATAVAFNGVSATNFTVVSVVEIDAAVPAAATTGPISVTTPAGGIASATNFTVISGPANDAFAAPQNLTGASGTFNGTTVGASKEVNEPNHSTNAGGASVWFTWTAPSSGVWSFDTAGSAFDTLLAVYTGNALASLVQVAANDDTGGGQSSLVSFTAGSGTQYRLAVDGFGGAAGIYALHWALTASQPVITGFTPTSGTAGTTVSVSGSNFTGATSVKFNGTAAGFVVNSATNLSATVPASAGTGPISVSTPAGTATSAGNFVFTGGSVGNDSFANAIVLTGSAAAVTGNNSAATKEAGEPSHAGNAGGKSLWYRWTAPATGQWTLDTIGSGFDTILAVYTGSAVNALTPVASDDDSGGNTTSKLTFNATSNVTYRIAVDGYAGASGDFGLHLLPASAITTIYTTGFEPGEGYSTALSWSGQGGWNQANTGGNGIVSNFFAGLGQQAYLGYDAPNFGDNNGLLLYRPINHTPDTNARPVVRFSVLMEVVDSSNGSYDDFRWHVFNQGLSNLFTLAFDNFDLGIYYRLDDGAGFKYTGINFNDNTPYLLEITMDFARNRWSATLNDGVTALVTLVNNLPITTTGATLDLGQIDPQWILGVPNFPGDNYLLLDNFSVIAEASAKPFILAQPLGQAVALGSNVTLTVGASGAAPLTYQWFFNTNALAGANAPALDLKGVTPAAAGAYFVIVSNSAGTATSSNALLTVTLPTLPLGDAVDRTNLVWATSGNGAWFGQTFTTFDGVDAAQSGFITNNQQSVLQTTVSNAGTLAFYWKVSSETNFDFLTLVLDGTNQSAISGEVNWQAAQLVIPAGTHTVQWIYSKDVSVSAGQDAAWVDQVTFAASFTSSNQPAQLAIPTRLTNGQEQFTFSGTAGGTYVIEASSNLVGWVAGGRVATAVGGMGGGV